ncbi:MAG: hypothetical protein K940chlam7_02097, partial [Chlamydiae bacterium]|nr:hypothetical protein [Chlamydiota bacterium]
YAGFVPSFMHFLSALEKGHTQLFLLMLNHTTTTAIDLDKLLLLTCGAKGNKEVALALIKKGANLTATDPKSGNSPLHEACRHGHNALVLEIIKRNPSTLNMRNKNGLYPTNYAIPQYNKQVAIPRCNKQVFYAMEQENAPCSFKGSSIYDDSNPLLYAVAAGDIEWVQQILKSGPLDSWLYARVKLPEYSHPKTGRVISIAIKNATKGDKYEEIALLLLQQMERLINTKDLLTKDTLYVAAQYGLDRVIEKILRSPRLNVEEKQVLLDYEDREEDGTPIETACELGELECAQLLMELDPKLAEQDQDNLMYVAYQAIDWEWKEFLEALLAKVRLDLNKTVQICSGEPLLISAFDHPGGAEIAKLLIEKGADLTVTSTLDGSTLADLTARRCDSEKISLIFSKIDEEKLPSWITSHRTDGITLLHQACGKERYDKYPAQRFDLFLSILLAPLTPEQRTAFINTTTQKSGETALHLSLKQEGFVENALLLLQHGADVTIPNSEGRTALHIAASIGLNEVIGPLLEQNAPLDARDKQETTPLLLACQNGHFATAETLIERGADVTIAGSGLTMLQAASQNGWGKIVAFLLSKKNLNETTVKKEGSKALVLACGKGHFLIAGILLQNGAEVDTDDYAAMSTVLSRMDTRYPLTQSTHRNIYSKMAKEFVQDPIKTLQTGLDPLVFFNTEVLYSEKVSDKKIVLRKGGKEYAYWVNSKLLAARSEYFFQLFNGSYKEGESATSTIEMHDIDPASFSAVLQYLYTQRITVTHD